MLAHMSARPTAWRSFLFGVLAHSCVCACSYSMPTCFRVSASPPFSCRSGISGVGHRILGIDVSQLVKYSARYRRTSMLRTSIRSRRIVRRHCCCQHGHPFTAAWSNHPAYAQSSTLVLVNSGAGPLWRSSTLLGGRSVLFLFIYFIFFHRITWSWPHILILVSEFPLHLVPTHYCSPLLGGYGARTRGVYQHLTLNGIYIKKPKTK